MNKLQLCLYLVVVVRPGERLAVLPNQDHGEEPHTPPYDGKLQVCGHVLSMVISQLQ